MQLIAFIAVLLGAVYAHPYYRDSFPNGYSVPNPCAAGIWEAVGHYDAHHHTINKNRYGQAFSAAGHVWTQALCMADSDGDGKTNGAELGDPHLRVGEGAACPPAKPPDIRESASLWGPVATGLVATVMAAIVLGNKCVH